MSGGINGVCGVLRFTQRLNTKRSMVNIMPRHWSYRGSNKQNDESV